MKIKILQKCPLQQVVEVAFFYISYSLRAESKNNKDMNILCGYLLHLWLIVNIMNQKSH